MAQDQFAVGRCADVHLKEVGAHPDRLLVGRERVLGVMQVLAAVGDGNDLPRLGQGRRREQRQQA